MRPVIKVIATRTDTNEVFFQASNALHYFGALAMPIKEYRSFINALLTGSGASGSEGCEVSLEEHGFDQWKEKGV